MKKEVLNGFIDKKPWIKRSSEGLAMTFNVLIKKEDDIYIAHCLELDIVATADTVNQAKKDIISLIIAQIDYAFSNDNLEHLFHPAPQEVWAEFFSGKEKAIRERHKIESSFEKKIPSIPPWIITNTLQAPVCHA